MTQKERMLAGQLYLVDEELAAEMRHTVGVLRQFNSEPEPEVRAALLRGLLGGTGRSFKIEPPFRCDYGSHIYLGENFYANYELIVLDQCDVRFGDNVMLGPRVSLFSAAIRSMRISAMPGWSTASPSPSAATSGWAAA